MELYEIDLYEYFRLPRGENKGGNMICMLHSNSREINAQRNYPSMLVIPGGGYAMCSDREAEPIAERYFAEGYNAYILRYSCAPSRYPVQIGEAAMAAAYIRRESARTHSGGKLAAVGFSAGGHLTGHLATVKAEDLRSVRLTPEEVRLDAAILCYAVDGPRFANGGTFLNLCAGDEALAQRLRIDGRIDKTTPPLFLFHTADDNCVDSEQALLIAGAAKEKGVPFELHIFASGCHGLSTCNEAVYRTGSVPATSGMVKKWLKLSVAFLKDLGFGYVD